MKLLNPTMFRLKPEQDAWLKRCADKDGHGNKAIVLRQLIDRAMRVTRPRRRAA